MHYTKVVLTAASEEYKLPLMALLGSLDAYWPNHPPVVVYNLGLSNDTLKELSDAGIKVRHVPEFCPHWRKHFTWKMWCWNDIDAIDVLWLDAGIVILHPLDEIFSLVSRIGYFVVPNYQKLSSEASYNACLGCRVDADFCVNKSSVSANVLAFRKEGVMKQVLEEALDVALVEENIIATTQSHRHDQAIISILMYKYLSPLVFCDGYVYAGWASPTEVPGQKIWAHRRNMDKSDMEFLRLRINRDAMESKPVFIVSREKEQKPVRLYLERVIRLVRRLLGADGSKRAGGDSSNLYDGVRNN